MSTSAPRWKSGNRFRLLENGEEFFPAVFEAIESAKEEVILETFILYEDKVGLALHECLLDAARRGVRVDVTMDGYGSPDLSTAFVNSSTNRGTPSVRSTISLTISGGIRPPATPSISAAPSR